MAKTLTDAYLFRKYNNYEKMLIEAIMEGEEIDKGIESFDSIVYEVKQRQIANSLYKVMLSKKIILLSPKTPLPKAFKVFAAKDIKGDKSLKVYIDCSNIILKDDKTGQYIIKDVDKLIAHLVNAMTTFIYYIDEKRIVMNTRLNTVGADAFSKLFTFVLNSAYKINTIPALKQKAQYLTAMYYLINILGMEYGSDSSQNIAKKISGISDREEELIKYTMDKSALMHIKSFVECLSEVLKLDKLTLDVVVEKWMYLYGTGTLFGLELFPAFSAMITDTYVGCYLNNQKTIEKVADRTMVEYSKLMLQIGADAL